MFNIIKILLSIILFIVINCKNIIISDDIEILNLITYDGSGQAVHPDILVDKYRFILTFTPFPYSDDNYENPSILISHNGLDFFQPLNVTNPIVNSPSGAGYNNDPDIFIDKLGKYRIIYNETYIDSYQLLKMGISENLTDWCFSTIDSIDLAKSQITLSPSFTTFNDKNYIFYVVHNSITLRAINNDFTFTGDPIIPIFEKELKFSPWHLDILFDGESFYMIVSGYEDHFNYQNLYIAKSIDLINWEVRDKPLLRCNNNLNNIRTLYRSTGYFSGDDLNLYISFENYDNEWLIGYKKYINYAKLF